MKVFDPITRRVVPGQPRSRAWVADPCPVVDATPKFERLYCAWVEACDDWRRTAFGHPSRERKLAEMDRTETAVIHAFRDLSSGYRSRVVVGGRVVWLRLNRDGRPVCVTHGPRSLPLSAALSRGRRGA